MENLSLDNIGFWLAYAQRCLAYAFSEMLKACCEQHGKPYSITPSQWPVLALLYASDGLTAGMISQRCALEAPTITGIVTRLEQNGLVERRHDREDRRTVKAYLTDEGRMIVDLLIPIMKTHYANVVRVLSEDEQQELMWMLQQLITNTSVVFPGAGDRFGRLPDRSQLQIEKRGHTQTCADEPGQKEEAQ
ncbi:MAG TPA: MarR family transcriptional regulator [Ktedonobacteraceae bacterium]